MATKTKKDLKKLLKTVEKRKSPKLNPDQKLSLCMIVKNESKHLARCLESVDGVVDEIIVVDTGSTDDTVEIAKKYDAKVYNYEWNDDFSAARNESIKHATGDWVLILDADEEISEISKEKIRAFLVDIGSDIYYQLRIKNLGLNDNILHENYMVRMFKNSPQARFIGRIHEFIAPSSGFINISDNDVSIIHHGYKPGSEAKITGRNLPILESIIKDDKAPEAYKSFINYYIGISQVDLGKMDDAVKYLRQSIDQLKNEAQMPSFAVYSYLRLMNTLTSLDRIKELEDLVNVAKDECPNLKSIYEYWYYCAIVEFYSKNYGKALEFLDKSVEVYNVKEVEYFRLIAEHAIYYFALYLYANVYFELNDRENTLKYLNRALEESKGNFDYPNYKLSLAKLFVELNDYDKAIEVCKEILELVENKSRNEVITYLSNLYLKTNQFEQAVKLQSTIHSPETVKKNWYGIAKALEDEKYFPAAESVYSAIVEVLPEEIQAYMGRAVARLVQNKTIDALSDLATAKKASKENEDKIKLSLIYLQIGQVVQARNCLEEVLKKSPEDHQANLYMANIEQAVGKLNDAEERLNRVINLFPNDSRAYIQLGNMLLSSKQLDKAIETFEKIKEIEPNNGYVYYALGIGFMEKGEKELALENIDKALKIEPDNEGLKNLHKMISEN